MKVYLLRTYNRNKKKMWVVFDTKNKIVGRPSQSMKNLLIEWRKSFGEITATTRYVGLCRPSEAAMTITETQNAEGEK